MEAHRSPPAPSLARLLFSLLWRASLAFFVFGIAFLGFLAGAEVSERNILDDGLLAYAYYALGLFVLGGMELGTPVGGHWIARGMLWFAYFVAPLLTASAILEALARAIAPHLAGRVRMRRHIVIVGLGQLGRLYYSVVRKEEPWRNLVLVDHSVDALEALGKLGRNTHVVIGDITRKDTRKQLFLGQAEAVMLLTGNDLTNMEAAADIGDEVPSLKTRMVLHLSDIEMKRRLAAGIRKGGQRDDTGSETMILKIASPRDLEADDGGVLPLPRGQIFNSRRIAARHLVLNEMREHFERTDPVDCVVIAGFGRFGSAILELLQRELHGEFDLVVVLDRQASVYVRQFVNQVGIRPGYRLYNLDGDLADPQTWEQVQEKLRGHPAAEEPVFVLGTGDDPVNLRNALALSQDQPGARILCRVFEVSAFSQKLADQAGFEVFGIGTLLSSSLIERHHKWFG